MYVGVNQAGKRYRVTQLYDLRVFCCECERGVFIANVAETPIPNRDGLSCGDLRVHGMHGADDNDIGCVGVVSLVSTGGEQGDENNCQ